MPIRDIDVNKLESCEDLPEAPRKKKSIILSIIGIVLLLADVIGMIIITVKYGPNNERPDFVKAPSTILETCWLISLVLVFIAFKYNRQNLPFKIFLGLWAAYMFYFVLSLTVNVPFI